MRICDILSEDLIIPEIRATTKAGVIQEIVEHLSAARKEIDRDLATRVLIDRERLGSTGVGQGFAIPHGKLPNLKNVICSLARSERGVEFESLDHQPAYLFLTLLAPEGSAGLHLKALARASRLFKEPEFRDRLKAQSDRKKLWQIIREQDERLAQGDELRG